MPHNPTIYADLGPQQLLALEQLATGATVIRAAEAARVSRETVHRWMREDWDFLAALNRARHDVQEAMQRRLLVMAEKAMTNVERAINGGNLNASLIVLKGLGVLGGGLPGIGSDDPSVLAESATLQDRIAEEERELLSLGAGSAR